MGGIVKPEEASFSFVYSCSNGDNYLQFDYFHEVLPGRCFEYSLTI